MPITWMPLFGEFDLSSPNVIIFKGSPPTTDGQLQLPPVSTPQVGILLNDQIFGGGTIEATITLSNDSNNTCGLILFYQPATKAFVQAQLGGAPGLVSVHTFANNQWLPHGAAGQPSTLQSDRPYRFRVRAAGSFVELSVDEVRLLSATLPIPLPTGQTGIWCAGNNVIRIEEYSLSARKPQAFVVMQFSNPYDDLYSAVIKPVCEQMGLQVERADEALGPGLIIRDVERAIVEAQVIIADISPANPNVYYEVGYAHALRKPTVLIADIQTKLPFDVSAFRTLFYENSIGGKAKVESALRRHLEAILREVTLS